MKNLLTILVCFAAACSTKAAAGPKGDKGDAGAQGLQGPQGDTGAGGVCDTSSCPQVTSINGLSGGTVNGATSFSSSVTFTSMEISTGFATPAGVTIESGGQRTSINGFYCGQHSDVDGDMFSTTNHSFDTLSPMRRGKKYCEAACNAFTNAAAAHPCSTTELVVAQQLGGGIDVTPNTAVPMPPQSVTGWIISLDPTNSCADFTDASSNPNGTIFTLGNNEGQFQRGACNATLPLFCCL